MERLFRDKFERKPGGGLKDLPQCEMCGRPVKVNNVDYSRDEILCPTCAYELKASDSHDEYSRA